MGIVALGAVDLAPPTGLTWVAGVAGDLIYEMVTQRNGARLCRDFVGGLGDVTQHAAPTKSRQRQATAPFCCVTRNSN